MTTRRVTVALAATAIGLYYLWCVQAAGDSFNWGLEHNGYYNYLGRAFAGGQLHLPLQPAPELLAAPNPWDPALDERYKMHDMAFFNGRYYLYHGAAPAVLLFAPWKLITGRDLPERFALFLFCFGGFLFSCAAFLQILRLADAKPGPAALAAAVAALGLCQSVPFLFSRVWLYEVAIGGGYFCLTAAFYFLVRGWLAASGLMFGLAVACRPHLGLAGLIVLGGLALQRTKAAPFAASFAIVCSAIALYNYQRFGNPFEFGLRYLLTHPGQNQPRLAAEYVPPGIFFLLLNPPEFSAVFPFARMVIRQHPDNPGYFLESITGALHLAPFILLAGRVRSAAAFGIATAAISSAAIFLFLTATGWATQRYEVDFLPAAVLAALATLCIARRRIWLVPFTYGAIVSLAIAIAGPYEGMLKNRPADYVRLARWFSPFAEHRPLLNPEVSVQLRAEPGDSGRRTLLRMGHHYALYLDRDGETMRLVSESEDSKTSTPMPVNVASIFVTFTPETREVTVTVEGYPPLVHLLKALVTAPSQVTSGETVTFFLKSINGELM